MLIVYGGEALTLELELFSQLCVAVLAEAGTGGRVLWVVDVARSALVPERAELMLERVRFLRQQADKPVERPNLCLADFIDPDGDTERYLVGHIEERTDSLEVVSPTP